MTLVLAIRCSDGVVIAADSASSDMEVGTKQATTGKIKTLGNLPILYGGSGNVSLLQNIHAAIPTNVTQNSAQGYRRHLKGKIVPVLKEARDLHIPHQTMPHPPAAILLFAGVVGRIPWILEIERTGEDTLYDDDLGNFAAIGSGKPWAQAFFRPHLTTPRDCRLGKIFACRVLEDSINLAAGGLAHPIHIYSINLEGAISQSQSDELREISQTCELWRELERESVGELLARLDGTPTEVDIDIPEPPR